jgi:hypothetical protein
MRKVWYSAAMLLAACLSLHSLSAAGPASAGCTLPTGRCIGREALNGEGHSILKYLGLIWDQMPVLMWAGLIGAGCLLRSAFSPAASSTSFSCCRRWPYKIRRSTMASAMFCFRHKEGICSLPLRCACLSSRNANGVCLRSADAIRLDVANLAQHCRVKAAAALLFACGRL